MKNDFWKTKAKQAAVLSPVDRISEVLFGLIMVLTFTGAISVSTDAREDVRDLLWAALGCNVAWGLVDAIMYLMSVALERGHTIRVIRKINATKMPRAAADLLQEELPPAIAGLMKPEELQSLTERIKKIPAPAKSTLITTADLLAGVQIFLLVFLCTLPVALPFAFITEIEVAVHTSNIVALVMLFIGGYILAGYAGFKKLKTAIVYTLLGVALVSITMALGG